MIPGRNPLNGYAPNFLRRREPMYVHPVKGDAEWRRV
jgi:hypothetical protein